MKKNLCLIFTVVILLGMLMVGFVSLVDVDPTISLVENRKLATFPKFSWSALFDGSFITELETYYADTFPMRESLMSANKKLNAFYHYSGSGDNNMLIIGGSNGAEQGGQNLNDYQQAIGGGQQSGTPENGGTTTPPEETDPEQIQPEQPTQTDPDEPETPVENNSGWEDNNDAEVEASYGSIIIIGDQAMEVPNAVDSVITDYAEAVSGLAAALLEVQIYSLVTPNSAQFYSPQEFHTGIHDQKAMIDDCYAQMSDDVVCVDAYSALAAHTNEYIYFRTDHHWTARGAYWGYTAFCEAKGIEPVPLEDFERGQYDEFVGSLYSFTSQYPQSDALWNNPDYVEYFLPRVSCSARYYNDATLSYGTPIEVVSTTLTNASIQNKYLCFISGDTPICVIETTVDGPVCAVLKESYGNAFVPFLTSHYSKIIVIDPREFNHQDKPVLDLKTFAAEQGVDDLIVINYPFMINNSTYVNYLNALIGA